MTARDFCFWLQGFFEIDSADKPQLVGTPLPPAALEPKQVDAIRRHLALVFAHDIDPKAGGPEVQAALNALHTGKVVSMRC